MLLRAILCLQLYHAVMHIYNTFVYAYVASFGDDCYYILLLLLMNINILPYLVF